MSASHLTITPAIIQRVCEIHHLGGVESLAQAGHGRNNPSWIVNDRFVLRFDGLDLDDRPSRFVGEQRAYEILGAHGLPVPEVIALDLTRAATPCDYIVLSRLPGRPVIDSWPDLSGSERRSAARQAGQYLARMHEIVLTGYGHLRHADSDRFPTWYAYLADYLARYGSLAVDAGILTRAQSERMASIFADHQPVFDAVVPARLVHWDYHFENILQQGGQITGILDFEWALAGDPTHDLRQETYWEETCPGSRDLLYAGYAEVRPFADDHDLRLSFYRLLAHLDDAVDAFDPIARRQAAARLVSALDTHAYVR